MGRRQNHRETVSLSVRIFGTDSEGNAFARLAHTFDIGPSGARISGVYLPLKPGNIIGMQHGVESARFRVVWVGKRGSSNAGQIGVVSLQPEKNIWNREFPVDVHDNYKPSPALTERRGHLRFDCDLGVELRVSPDSPPTLLRCTDISRGGCYLESWSPMPIGTTVHLVINLPKGDFLVAGVVRTMDPGFGMGIRFSNIKSTLAFDEFIQQLHLQLNPHPPTPVLEAPVVTAKRADSEACGARRILLAEDSRFLRSAYALFLRREGYVVITADDGDQALNLAAIERPDVIVLDLLMPRLGGVGALKLLKENSATTSIPVIVLSGLPSSNESKLLECGAFAYLAKTQVGPEDLPRHVQRAIEHSAGSLHFTTPPFGTPSASCERLSQWP